MITIKNDFSPFLNHVFHFGTNWKIIFLSFFSFSVLFFFSLSSLTSPGRSISSSFLSLIGSRGGTFVGEEAAMSNSMSNLEPVLLRISEASDRVMKNQKESAGEYMAVHRYGYTVCDDSYVPVCTSIIYKKSWWYAPCRYLIVSGKTVSRMIVLSHWFCFLGLSYFLHNWLYYHNYWFF